MKKLMHKAAVVAAIVGATGVALAEDAAGSTVDASLVTSFITDGKTQVVTVLTAGAAIVGAFFVWNLIKKALHRSK